MLQSKLPNVGTTIFTVMSAMASESGAINLAQGFPDFEMDRTLIDLVYKNMTAGMNQYAPMSGVPALCDSLAEYFAHYYGFNPNPRTEITIMSGAAEAIFCGISAFVHSGDEVIIVEPAYDLYAPAIELCGGKIVPLVTIGPEFKLDHNQLQALITEHTRMLIINTPNNPTATIYDDEDMKFVAKLAVEHDFLVLSDEVYDQIIFDGQQHQSILKYPELYGRAMATYSFGKTFHCTGWRIGYIVAAENLMKEIRKVHQYCTFSVNTPLQYALAEYLNDRDRIDEVKTVYKHKRDLFMDILSQTAFKPLACKGTYFMVADYSAISSDHDMRFAEYLCRKVGVATVPLSPFYINGSDQKLIRFCFAKKDETLYRAGEKLVR